MPTLHEAIANPQADFSNEMARQGLACHDPIIPDGQIHRFHVEGDKAHAKNGWYVAFTNDNPTIVFGSWKTQTKHTWSSINRDDFTDKEQLELEQRLAQAQQAANQQRQNSAKAAEDRAQFIWRNAALAPENHPYLTKKKIQPHNVKIYKGSLVIPIYGGSRTIASLQFIDSDGKKIFLKGGAKQGGCYQLGEVGEQVFICEGFATAATIHEVSEECVVAAFDAGNLQPVAERIRHKFPNLPIILAADNDVYTSGNPGLCRAQEAARSVKGLVASPVFKKGHVTQPTDFNDLCVLEGPEQVKQQLHNAQPYAAIGWCSPVLLDSEPLPKLPTGLLPSWLEDMVNAVSKATETPPELAMCLGLGVLAAACQRTFEVEPSSGYIEPLNLFIIPAMESGNRKTAVLGAMTEPLLAYERKQTQDLMSEKGRLESEHKTKEMRIQHLRTQVAKQVKSVDIVEANKEIAELEESLPTIPTLPQLWAQDVTPEKLGQLMAEQNGAMALISDEGGLFETFAGRYNGGIPNLDLLLKSHSCSGVRIHRASAIPIDLPRPTLTIALSPQPDILRGLTQKPGFRGCGLLARFLYCLPESRLGYRSLQSRPVSRSTGDTYAQALQGLLDIKLPQTEGETPERFRLQLEDKAYQEWLMFSHVVEHDLRAGERFEHLRDWAGKLPGAAARLAGLLHCATHWHNQPWSESIAKSTMEKALTLVSIFAEHALKAFNLMAANPDLEKAKKILSWIQRKGLTSFTQRDCHHDLQGSFPKVEDLKAGLSVLQERDIIRPNDCSEQKRAGRPSITYEVNPELTPGVGR